MSRREQFVPHARMLTSLGLAFLWLLFAAASAHASQKTGRPAGLGAVGIELIGVILFIARRPPEWASYAPGDWLGATIGTFGPLLARPSHVHLGGVVWVYEGVQLVGALCACACLLALGRSFGLVPANRGLCVNGPYRLVRHPLYASYMLVWIAYLVENPTTRNVVVFSVAAACQVIRMRREEVCLKRDPAYAAYTERVRYRVLPLVY